MAPMTRYHEEPSSRAQILREASWQFVDPALRTARDISVGAASSYDEDQDTEGDIGDNESSNGLDPERRALLVTADDNEDVLHPLRAAANRVGREVERFAEILDGYNPQRATKADERQQMMFDLVGLYRGVALDTAARLRDKHASDRRKNDGARWRKKMRGFKITQTDEMEIEDSDESDSPPPQGQTELHDLERWEEEAQTWSLLERLINLRVDPQRADEPRNSTSRHPQITPFSTERELWDHFLEIDELALERKVVLQWLKETANNNSHDIDILVQDLQQNAERGDVIAHGWIHTKAAIKNHKRRTAWAQPLDPKISTADDVLLNDTSLEPLTTQLDPDASTRQKRKLEDQDEFFERAIWLGCYEMLRRGKSSTEIKEWCLERTEVWRAVAMSGFPDDRSEALDNTRDPEAISLWRKMCFALARSGGGDVYEKAVYGLVSGDISSVEPVCKSWDDFIFTHYNSLLRSQFDNYLRSVRPRSFSSDNAAASAVFDAVQFYGDSRMAGKRLIDNLKTDARTSAESTKPLKMLQGVLIANQFANFIYQQGLAISKFANANGTSYLFPPNKQQPENETVTKYIRLDDYDSLRVLTHMLLIFMGLGMDLGGIFHETEVENVIVAYVSFLRLAGKEELIPLYCSQLSGKRKYAVLCRSLIDVTAHDQRITQIRLMRELGLDVQEFVKLQARFLLNDHPDTIPGYPASKEFILLEDVADTKCRKVRRDFFGDEDRVERIDLLLIRSLQWYLLVDGLWSETFTIGTMLYLRFFKNVHLMAARALCIHVSSSMISRQKTHAILGQTMSLEAMESSDEEDLTEILDGSGDQRRLLKAHLLAEAKSFRELEMLVLTLDKIETVSALEVFLDEDPNTCRDLNWRKELHDRSFEYRQMIQLFFKGWLLTSQRESAEAEFERLREAYLPETILAYIATLKLSGTHLTREFLLEAMDISTMIANEESDVLLLFKKAGRLQELIEALAYASKALLFISSSKTRSGLRKRKNTVKGWTPFLWNVKS